MTIMDLAQHVPGQPFKYKHGWQKLFGDGDLMPKAPAPTPEREHLRMVTDSHGLRHWGQYGGAGVLVRHTDENGTHRYFMQQRAKHVDQGGTWSTPGGGIDPGESVTDAAHREVEEEIGKVPVPLTHSHTVTADYGGWKYHTVVMDSPERFVPGGKGSHAHEDAGNGWYTADEIGKMPLHPGFARSWPTVRDASGDVTIPAGADEAKEQAAKRAALAAELGKKGIHPFMTKAGAAQRGLAEARATGQAKFFTARNDFHEGKSYTYLENKPAHAPFYVLTPGGQIIYWNGHKKTVLGMKDMEMATPAQQALAIELAAINGHHVAGTAYHYYHGWKPREGQSLVADAKKGTHVSQSSPEEKMAKTKALKAALDHAKLSGVTEHVYVIRKPGKGGGADWKHGRSFSGHADLGTATNRTRYTITPDGTITKYQGKKALYTLNSREHVAAGLVPGDPQQSDIRRVVMDEDTPGRENIKAEPAAESKAEDAVASWETKADGMAAAAAAKYHATMAGEPRERSSGPSGPVHDKIVAGTTAPVNPKSPNSVLSHALVASHKSGKPLYVHKDQYGDWSMQTTPEPGQAGFIVHPDHHIESVSTKGIKYTYKPDTMEKVMAKNFGPQPEVKGPKVKLGKSQPAFATPGLNKPAPAQAPSVQPETGVSQLAVNKYIGSKSPVVSNDNLTHADALHKAMSRAKEHGQPRYVVNKGKFGGSDYQYLLDKPDTPAYDEALPNGTVVRHYPAGSSSPLPASTVLSMITSKSGKSASVPGAASAPVAVKATGAKLEHPFKVGDHVTGHTPSGGKVSGNVTHASHLASGNPYVMVKDERTGGVAPMAASDATLTSSAPAKKFDKGNLVSGYKPNGTKAQGTVIGQSSKSLLILDSGGSTHLIGMDKARKMEHPPAPDVPDNVPEHVITGRLPEDPEARAKAGLHQIITKGGVKATPAGAVFPNPPTKAQTTGFHKMAKGLFKAHHTGKSQWLSPSHKSPGQFVASAHKPVLGHGPGSHHSTYEMTPDHRVIQHLNDGSSHEIQPSKVLKVTGPHMFRNKSAADAVNAAQASLDKGTVKPAAVKPKTPDEQKLADFLSISSAKAEPSTNQEAMHKAIDTAHAGNKPTYIVTHPSPISGGTAIWKFSKDRPVGSGNYMEIHPGGMSATVHAGGGSGTWDAKFLHTVISDKTGAFSSKNLDAGAPKAKKVYASTPAGQIAKAVDEFKVPDSSTSLSKGDAFKKAMHYAEGTGDSRYVTNPEAKKGHSYMSEAIGQYAYAKKKPAGDAPYYEIKPDHSVVYHGDAKVDIAPENVAKTVNMSSTSFGAYVAPTAASPNVPDKELLGKFTAGQGFSAGNVAPPTQKDLDMAHAVMAAVHEKIDNEGLGNIDHLKSHYKSKVVGKASQYEKGELRKYTESSNYVNTPLRKHGGKLPAGHPVEQAVGNLDSLMAKYKTDKPLRVYRGVGGGVFPEGTDVTGHVYTEPGYSSTSLGTGFSGIKMAITVPAGSHVAFPKGFGSSVDTHPGEQEVLLPRNTRYLVISDEMKGGTRHVEMVVLPPIKEGQTSAQLAASQAASTAKAAKASSTVHHAA